MILSILCDMGLSVIDDNLEKLMTEMNNMPSSMGEVAGYARALGACLAVVVGASEAYMMMLGRKGVDIMKLLRIMGIAICITLSGSICEAAKAPGLALEQSAKEMANGMSEQVKQKEEEVHEKQEELLAALRAIGDRISQADATKPTQDSHWWDAVGDAMDDLAEQFTFWFKTAALWLETYVVEIFSTIIRWIGEVLFQVMYYGMMVCARMFLAILTVWCPMAFALSLAPVFKNAWSQWLSKFISISLWGWVIFITLYYVEFILLYNLEGDLASYTAAIGEANEMTELKWETVASVGLQGLGSTCMYLMGCLVGCLMLKQVPEVAGWLIPGGVSSGMGGAVGGLATAGMSSAGAFAGGAAGAALGGANAARKAGGRVALSAYGGYKGGGAGGSLKGVGNEVGRHFGPSQSRAYTRGYNATKKG